MSQTRCEKHSRCLSYILGSVWFTLSMRDPVIKKVIEIEQIIYHLSDLKYHPEYDTSQGFKIDEKSIDLNVSVEVFRLFIEKKEKCNSSLFIFIDSIYRIGR